MATILHCHCHCNWRDVPTSAWRWPKFGPAEIATGGSAGC